MSPIFTYNDGPVFIIQIDRLDVRNAIDADTATALRHAWQTFDADHQALVGVLTGGNQVFCAGADLTDLPALSPAVNESHGPLGFTRLKVGKPTIAAIAGYCVAGGLEMACWCDLRVADETAVFGCFERRFGVPLVDGGTQRLPRIIGLGRALEMILTGRAVTATEAREIGLVNRLAPAGQALATAVELAKQIAAFPQNCVRHDRMAVYDGIGQSLASGLQLEAEHGLAVLESGEPERGAKRFQDGER